jgi:hypothetical protein
LFGADATIESECRNLCLAELRYLHPPFNARAIVVLPTPSASAM